MNFYKHHIGDYDADTAHLSWDEDMAYTRMMRAYYRREKPLPAEIRDVCRLVRAVSSAQRKAVETVLNEFFTMEPDGWHQKRCDEELSLANEKAEQNRSNGKKGGRPRKVANPEKTESVSENKPTENPDGFVPENPDGLVSVSEKNLSQTPDSRLQKKEKKPRVPRFDAQAHLESLGVESSVARDWLTLRKGKRLSPTETAFVGVKAEADRAGVSMDDALRTCCLRGWGGFKAEWLERPAGRVNGHSSDEIFG